LAQSKELVYKSPQEQNEFDQFASQLDIKTSTYGQAHKMLTKLQLLIGVYS